METGPTGLLEEDAAPRLLLDRRGCVVDANAGAVELLGLDRRYLLRKPFVLFVEANDRRAWFDALRVAGSRRRVGATLHCEVLGRTGVAVPVEAALTPLAEPDDRILVAVEAAVATPAGSPDKRILDLEHRHRQALFVLDEVLRPRPMDMDGLELGSEAHAADDGSLLGGDLCDWLTLPDGRVHLSVVDAEGRGVLATRVALVVRSTLRALALENASMAEMLSRAERLCDLQEPGATAAVTVLRYDPATRILDVSRAGDPPPLLVDNDGGIREIGPGSQPLGYGEGRRRHVTRERLGEDDLLVVYTDGLLDGSPTPLDGLASIKHRVAALREPPDDLSTAEIAYLLLRDASQTDDALVAVLRSRPQPPTVLSRPDDDDFHAVLRTSGHHHLGGMRQLLADWLGTRSVPREVVRDALLVVTELAVNATNAHRSRSELRVSLDGGGLAIEVVDDGTGLRVEDFTQESADMDFPGFGLHIIEAVCTDVQVVPSRLGTVVRCRLAW